MKDKKKVSNTHSIWGGRFHSGSSYVMERINSSIGVDMRLFSQDILGSKAHADMLAACDIISEEDAIAICKGLDLIEKEIKEGQFNFKSELEDIHMNIESRLLELIGEPAHKLHTARSRNDQVATDFKLWVRDAIDRLNQGILELQEILINQAEEHISTIMPGFTHLQIAQPIVLGQHLLAYVEMFGRDRGRATDARKRLNECPLGAAALAGTSFCIDRAMVSRNLGFDRPASNSLDAVSDRDFALEYLAVGSILAIHLTRLAEEIVLWSSSQFDYIKISESFSTGSSIMPQKRNPDAAELVRGKAGRVFGALNTLLVSMKGLPLAYCKDMQEDKEPVFDTADTLELCLLVMGEMLKGVTFNKGRMKADAELGFSVATDFADWLVTELDIPFRQAHHITGEVVKLAEKKCCSLDNLSLTELQSINPGIDKRIYTVLSAEKSIENRTSYGGTSSKEVKKRLGEARKRYLRSVD